jgi:CRISPR/Cas system CSM-associated protein Csm2 small subunit
MPMIDHGYLVRNNDERRDAIMDASEFLARIIAYHTIIDNN